MKSPRIVALGDSTTAGTPGWLSPIEAPPNGRGDETSQYAYWLMRSRPDWDVLNRGVNGERSDQIRARFETDVLAAAPHAVVVIAGVNDVYQGLSAAHVIRQLEWMYEQARLAGILVVAGTIVPYNTATPEQNARMRETSGFGAQVSPSSTHAGPWRRPATLICSRSRRTSSIRRLTAIAGWLRRSVPFWSLFFLE
jgi:lysophospholipase L1-like esterase